MPVAEMKPLLCSPRQINHVVRNVLLPFLYWTMQCRSVSRMVRRFTENVAKVAVARLGDGSSML